MPNTGLWEGIGWASIQASATGPTVVRWVGGIDRQKQIGKQASEEEVATRVLVDDQSILCLPTYSSELGEFAFKQRRRIDDAARFTLRVVAGQLLCKDLQLGMNHIVIVGAHPGIPSQLSDSVLLRNDTCIFLLLAAKLRVCSVIGQSQYDDRANPFHHSAWMAIRGQSILEIIHLPRETGLEPFDQPAVSLRGNGGSNAQVGKAKQRSGLP